ncbi:MAG: ATP-binding protein [Planctomycetota bacterium]
MAWSPGRLDFGEIVVGEFHSPNWLNVVDASVYIQSGRQSGTKIVLRSGATTFGRSSANHVQLLDRETSRHHFELVLEVDVVSLRDLGSANGTFVNGSRTHFRQLQTGDQIRAGQTELLFTGGHSARAHSSFPGVSVQLVREPEIAEPRDPFCNEFARTESFEVTPRRALEVEARSRSDLDFLQEAFQSLGSGLSVDELFAQMLERIFSWVNVDRACVVLGGREGEEFVVTAARLREPSSDSTMRVSRAILRHVQSRNVGLLTHDARDDSRWEDSDPNSTLGIHEAICVPLLGRSEFLGAIYVDTFLQPGGRGAIRERVLTDEHLKIMVAVGKLAGLALENARYSEQLVAKARLAAIGETIASLSHHIKNILQGMSSGTYLLEQGLKHQAAEDTQRGWEIVRRYQDAISRLVLDMLSYSRERQPSLVPADLNQTVGECVELVRPRAESLGIKLVWEPARGLSNFEFDPFGLTHAITNLLQNALDACEHKGAGIVQVSVLPEPSESRCRIVVQDNGMGIPGADLERIFQLFHSTKGNKGTGLGLAVSRKIVEEHGGQITVESILGSGSRFTILLPTATRQQTLEAEGETVERARLQPKFKSAKSFVDPSTDATCDSDAN